MAPGGTRYTDRLEVLVRLAQKLVGVVRCGVWVVVVVACVVEACACCDALAASARMDMTNTFSHELRM
jgi:hypothetical protein